MCDQRPPTTPKQQTVEEDGTGTERVEREGVKRDWVEREGVAGVRGKSDATSAEPCRGIWLSTPVNLVATGPKLTRNHVLATCSTTKAATEHSGSGFVYEELIPKGRGGSVWVPQKGRLFKFDFPSAKFWVKIWVGGSQSPKTPPPIL